LKTDQEELDSLCNDGYWGVYESVGLGGEKKALRNQYFWKLTVLSQNFSQASIDWRVRSRKEVRGF